MFMYWHAHHSYLGINVQTIWDKIFEIWHVGGRGNKVCSYIYRFIPTFKIISL